MTDEKNQDKENTHHEIIDKTDNTNDYQEKDILEDEAFKYHSLMQGLQIKGD